MKSIAGSIVVLAGAIIMGLRSEEIPDEPLPTLFALGLTVIGLALVFLTGGSEHDTKNMKDAG